MRILYILPGSGGSFYCQNCLRDMALADALRQRGHTVISMPLYLPATAQAAAPDAVPVFYGAVSLYCVTALPYCAVCRVRGSRPWMRGRKLCPRRVFQNRHRRRGSKT